MKSDRLIFVKRGLGGKVLAFIGAAWLLGYLVGLIMIHWGPA